MTFKFLMNIIPLIRGLLFCVGLLFWASVTSAHPDKFIKDFSQVINPSQGSSVDGFYLAKSKDYYSYVYLMVNNNQVKAAFEYKEDGEVAKGYFIGQYQSNKNYALGKICYEDTNEWLGNGAFAFSENANQVMLNIFYTETLSDSKWVNDWSHTKVADHKKLKDLDARLHGNHGFCGDS